MSVEMQVFLYGRGSTQTDTSESLEKEMAFSRNNPEKVAMDTPFLNHTKTYTPGKKVKVNILKILLKSQGTHTPPEDFPGLSGRNPWPTTHSFFTSLNHIPPSLFFSNPYYLKFLHKLIFTDVI